MMMTMMTMIMIIMMTMMMVIFCHDVVDGHDDGTVMLVITIMVYMYGLYIYIHNDACIHVTKCTLP